MTMMQFNRLDFNTARFTLRKGVFQIKRVLRQTVRRAIRITGYDLTTYYPEGREFPVDFTSDHITTINAVKSYTLTPPERIYALIEAVRHIARKKIPGSLVECGVWRGGSMMAAAMTLRSLNCCDRDLYLFDTFEGMPKPTTVDVDFSGDSAMAMFSKLQTGDDTSDIALQR
jgi:O-methyltransferase